MAKNTELHTASVLAFERKLDPSDALLFSGQWPDRDNPRQWAAIPVREKSVRGTISNRLKGNKQDPAKLDAAIQNPNLQTVDVAMLPNDRDTLMARFTLKVLGGAGKPSACNSAPYQAKLESVVNGYVDKHGFSTLARRYAQNIANARFLWRNRMGAEAVEVRVERKENGATSQAWTFNALEIPVREFIAQGAAETALQELAEVIRQGLAHEEIFVLLEITAFARMGAGQEVFPSQELILDRGQGNKSKTLYTVDQIAGIHSQKLGNAIRTIDTWYPAAAERGTGPIAVEPYGSVTTQGTAFRQPKEKVDFYSLLDNWILKDQEPAVDQQHFVLATIVRGGVFGEKVD